MNGMEWRKRVWYYHWMLNVNGVVEDWGWGEQPELTCQDDSISQYFQQSQNKNRQCNGKSLLEINKNPQKQRIIVHMPLIWT